MNTYHINPTDSLAPRALPEVQAIFDEQGDVFIAVRGRDFEYGDGETDETVYTVSVCPNQEDQLGYEWTYVSAKTWLETFQKAIYGIVDIYGREVCARRFVSKEDVADYIQNRISPYGTEVYAHEFGPQA
jgi:hypothetical protein